MLWVLPPLEVVADLEAAEVVVAFIFCLCFRIFVFLLGSLHYSFKFLGVFVVLDGGLSFYCFYTIS